MANDTIRRYWRSLEERDADDATRRAAADEFPAPLVPDRVGRRGFLKAAGFSLATVAAGCSRAPVEKAIPFLVQPEQVTPGRALYYASTCGACSAACGLLVKTRDGRPIKIEGNPQHPLSRGGVCAVGQAAVLELYDSRRYTGPRRHGQTAGWDEVDREVVAALDTVRREGRAVRLVTGTVTSPTLAATIATFLSTFPDGRHVVYDPLSSSAILDAHRRTHGRRVLPHYRFDRAAVIVSVDADFLGTWIAPVEFTQASRDGRSLKGTPPRCSYHVQIEARLSITGSKADARVRLVPADQRALVGHLAARLAGRAGEALDAPSPDAPPVDVAWLDDLADRLWRARGESLVVCASQDVETQVACNVVNRVLASYGSTIDLDAPSFQRQGNDAEVERLLDELGAGSVGALLVAGANPVYDLPVGEELAALAKAVPLVVSFARAPDETSAVASHVCPDHHDLEGWGDSEPVAGVASVRQPAIRPLGDTRAVVESLARWTGDARPAYELVRAHWQRAMFGRQAAAASFQEFWDRTVYDGSTALTTSGATALAPTQAGAPPREPVSEQWDPASPAAPPPDTLALVLYATTGMLAGAHAHNPWLQELPDPIAKVTWDNCAALSPATATRLGLAEGDMVRLETADDGGPARAIELPVYVQPGQHDGVAAVALGYGRAGTDRFATIGPRWLDARPSVGGNGLVGVNAAPLLALAGGALWPDARRVRLVPAGRRVELATTQRHNRITASARLGAAALDPRPIVRETTVADLGAGGHAEPPREELWPDDHPYTGHRWGLAVDLDACTGCSACVVACQAENNIPVVGRDEVRRSREMHWLRIDRYYTDTADGGVDVVHQPMLCQHCAHAPCETVCPVLATVHSADGLNEQVYNRCVGTRYCANNCPYKVRRFNWFTYRHDDARENLVLNPDVTVRTRGVMEKCSLCVQRIQDAKVEAQRRDVALADGAIQTACSQSCPARAIVFGDLNDPTSRVATLAASGRAFRVLEELNVRPGVHYLSVVRNRPASGSGEPHA